MPSVIDDLELHPARLIPAIGIGKGTEQEERATSALLAVMGVVPSFGKRILKYLGAPGGTITAFTEPHLETRDGLAGIPDGMIVVERGSKRWVALVEVKTARNNLDADQIDRYLQIANGLGFDAMLTISNEIIADPTESPVRIDKRRTRKVRLGHLSWSRIMTEAVIEVEHHGVDDPEQAWILGELIAYMDNENSGAGGYEGMGAQWVAVRNAARQHTLRATDPGVKAVAEDWEEFVEYLALKLRQSLGRKVKPAYPRSSTRDSRLRENADSLGDSVTLFATIKVPDAAAPVEIEANLAARQVTTFARVPAPKEGRAKTRINWILRQLRDTPSDLRIEVHFSNVRATTSDMVESVRSRPESLLLADDTKREPTAFTLALTRDMGGKRGKSKGSFAAESMEQTLAFYGDVLQKVTRWTPPAPKLKKVEEKEEEDESSEPFSRGEYVELDEADSLSSPGFARQESGVDLHPRDGSDMENLP